MGRLQDQRIWLAGGALAALLLVAVSWLIFVGPELSSASDLQEQALASRQQNELLESKTDSLQAKSTKLDRYTSSLKAALAALPYDSGLAAFTRQLNAQGQAHDVSVSSVVVAGVAPVVPAAAPAASADGVATDGTPEGSVAGLFSMQVTVTSNGSLRNQIAFLRAVRTVGPRRALVTAAQVIPGTGSKAESVNRNASFTTQITTFSAPRSATEIKQLNKLASGDLER